MHGRLALPTLVIKASNKTRLTLPNLCFTKDFLESKLLAISHKPYFMRVCAIALTLLSLVWCIDCKLVTLDLSLVFCKGIA